MSQLNQTTSLPKVLATFMQLSDVGGFRISYGSAGYQYYMLSETVELCKTTDDECVFLKVDDQTSVRIIHIKGDHNRIKELVKAEIDHFDSDLVWTN